MQMTQAGGRYRERERERELMQYSLLPQYEYQLARSTTHSWEIRTGNL